jgi:hypothetical protein
LKLFFFAAFIKKKGGVFWRQHYRNGGRAWWVNLAKATIARSTHKRGLA